MMINCKDFKLDEESVSAILVKVNRWISQHQIKVINLETLRFNSGGNTVQDWDCIRVWFYQVEGVAYV